MAATPKKVTVRNGVRYNGAGKRIDPWPMGRVGGGTVTVRANQQVNPSRTPRPLPPVKQFGGTARGDVPKAPARKPFVPAAQPKPGKGGTGVKYNKLGRRISPAPRKAGTGPKPGLLPRPIAPNRAVAPQTGGFHGAPQKSALPTRKKGIRAL